MNARALLLLLAAGGAAIEVRRIEVPLEQEYAVTVDNNVEYILEFRPTSEQAQWPVRMWLNASGGGPEQPVLITARQTTGAYTWQLPYRSVDESQLLTELEDTLCFQVNKAVSSSAFSLHLSSASNASVTVRTRASPARDFFLLFDTPLPTRATLTAPRVHFYQFAEGQDSVRLVLASEDDVCAVVSVRNYTCPLSHTTNSAMLIGGLQMTMQRSGGVHLACNQFPDGFYVLTRILDSDVPCDGVSTDSEPDWLWEAAVGVDVTTVASVARARDKTLTMTVRAALTVGQYAAAMVTTLAVFLIFYVLFLALVFAQRFEPVLRFVGPKAVYADNNGDEATAEDGLRRQRRLSTDTFDSLDDDSEDSDEDKAVRNSMGANTRTGVVSPSYISYTTSDTTPTELPNGQPIHEASVTQRENIGTETRVVENTTVPATNTVVDVPSANIPPTNSATDVPSANPVADINNATDGSAPNTVPEVPPYGLPPQLTLAKLSRRRARTLRARSDRYLHTLYTVAVFYALPVLQFVTAFQIVLNVSGSLDLCYYNFLCAHPFGELSDFNHVFSNLGYLLLGALFMLQVRRRRRRRAARPRHAEYGIPAHYGLLSSLGAGMMMVALLSASYHVCPNQLNFQFDTAFMYVLAVLSMVKMYQSRHPDVNARAHSTFGVLAVLIAFVVWGVLGGGALFWGLFTVLHVFTFLLLSLRIYYVGQFRLGAVTPGALAAAARGLRRRPLYVSRLAMLLVANAVNWAFAFYGLIVMSADFATHLLSILLCNTLLHMVFYLLMKLVHGERLRWYAWLWLAGAAAAWVPAMYFFVSGSSSWSSTPAHSRHRNHECRVMQFYDAHDLWHMLSAVALYFSFNAMLTWDDGLSAVKRTDIAVF